METAMLSAEAIEEYRAGLVRQFEQEKQQIDTQLASLETKNHELDAKLRRLRTEIPNPEACPTCYYLAGEIALIRPIPADPATPKIDRFRCANGHDF
jgi:hypothetical protein